MINQNWDQTKPVFKRRTADWAVYISPLFQPVVSFFNYIYIDDPASFIQSLFPTGQHQMNQSNPT